MGLHRAAQPAQVQSSIDPAQQMIDRNHIFEIEFIKKAVLPTHRLTHHRPDPLAQPSLTRNHDRPSRSKDFFNTLGYEQTSSRSKLTSALPPNADILVAVTDFRV